MKKNILTSRGVVSGLLLTVVLLAFYALSRDFLFTINIPAPDISLTTPFLKKDSMGGVQSRMKKFGTSGDFFEYLAKTSEQSVDLEFQRVFSPNVVSDASGSAEKSQASEQGSSGRVSTTNVQVTGIDEPDVVKTDGSHIFISNERFMYRTMSPVPGVSDERFYPESASETLSVLAAPPSGMSLDARLPRGGNILLHEDRLVVFSRDGLFAYDVSDAGNPREVWKYGYDEAGTFVDARLSDGMIYLVIRTTLADRRSCSFNIMKNDLESVDVPCTEIYHPVRPIASDSLFTVLKIDPMTGKSRKPVSFVGSVSNTAVYASQNFMYVAFSEPGNVSKMMEGFIRENPTMFPEWTIKHIDRLMKYELSDAARVAEIGEIFRQVRIGYGKDEKMHFENDMRNAMERYIEAHKRELDRTIVSKVELGNLEIESVGDVPGRFLNQFSFDEYEGNLRVATTVGSSWWNMGGLSGGRGESENDVYVLNSALKEIGSVEGLGKDERIYAVRFLGPTGFVVTFKETDPLYALDLSDPKRPEVKGELKIPGYSAYLHPIGRSRLIGVGKEGENVKISIFDVSNLDSPKEIAKYDLEEYWSEALTNHRAFLIDKKHEVFFMPGSRGGYVFSYANDELSLRVAFEQRDVKRAVYLGDYLYVVGGEGVTVFDETNWEKVNELDFDDILPDRPFAPTR